MTTSLEDPSATEGEIDITNEQSIEVDSRRAMDNGINHEEDDTEQSTDDEDIISVSKEDVSVLLEKMVSLGYFHENTDFEEKNKSLEDEDVEITTIESLRKHQTLWKEKFMYKSNKDCALLFPKNMPSNDGDDEGKQIFCMTREYLNEKVYSLVMEKGRLSLNGVCKEMKLSMVDVEIAAQNVIQSVNNNINNNNNNIMQGNQIYLIEPQMELVTDEYINNMLEAKVVQQLQEKGNICISELAMTYFHLPIEITVDLVNKRLINAVDSAITQSDQALWNFEKDVKIIEGNDGAKKLVTSKYEKELKLLLKDMLRVTKKPLKIKDIVKAIDWDTKLIIKEIETLCTSREVEGEVRTDTSSNTLMGAIYVPYAYEENQRNVILEYFQINGFVSVDKAKENGMSMKRCEKCIFEKFPDAIVLENCFISPLIIVEHLQVSVESCIDNKTFIDLSYHLPTELCCFKNDVRSIMEDYVLSNLESNGCLVIDEHELIYFSCGMIEYILKDILPTLIEDYAKNNAEGIADMMDERKKSNGTIESSKVLKKGKGRSKKLSTNNGDEKSPSYQDFMIPLHLVANRIMESYKDLVDIQETYSDNVSEASKWEPDDEGENIYTGPLCTFCRLALNTPSFQKICSNAVEAEVEKVLQSRGGASITKRGKGAAKCRSIDESFETSFPSACYYIQLMGKFSYVILADPEISNEDSELLRRNFIGQCAWFAKRITEYCLFKANFDSEGIFTFSAETGEEDNSNEGFASPVDFTKLHCSQILLACKSENKNPLKKLEDLFPGNIGIGLSKMWGFCGQDHYDCEDYGEGFENEFDAFGNFENFISHVEEYCLTMVGIPFKLLDKKSEKKLMISRRKVLTAQLQESTSPTEIFELTLVLLCQQTRSVTLYKEQITSAMLSWILREKKIPAGVKSVFDKIYLSIRDGTKISDVDVAKMKEVGFTKDISTVS